MLVGQPGRDPAAGRPPALVGAGGRYPGQRILNVRFRSAFELDPA